LHFVCHQQVQQLPHNLQVTQTLKPKPCRILNPSTPAP
jgi:hypothetical protein